MSDYPPPPPAYGSVPASPVALPAYASWLSRVGATLLDGLVAVAAAVPFGVVAAILAATTSMPSAYDSSNFDAATGEFSGSAAIPPAVGVFILLAYLSTIVFTVWNTVIRQGHTGQTLGKKWLGIRVVREETGGVPGVWLALGRYVLESILAGCTLYLDVLWPLWDSKKQTLHDKIVSTVVVRA